MIDDFKTSFSLKYGIGCIYSIYFNIFSSKRSKMNGLIVPYLP